MMRVFSASDVLYNLRYVPSLERAVNEAEVATEDPVESTFLADPQWLDPAFVAEQVAGVRSGEDAADDAAAPGLHGNGLGTVTLGGVALTPGATASVPLADDLTFEVQVSNQGENTETDVPVRVTLGDIEADGQVNEIAAGETQTVSVELPGSSRRAAERVRRGGGRAGAGRGADRQQHGHLHGHLHLLVAGVLLGTLSRRGRPDHHPGHRRPRGRRRRPARADLAARAQREAAPGACGPAHGARRRQDRPGGHAQGLQEAFVQLRDWVEETAGRLDERTQLAERRIDGCVAHTSLVRYDAYNEMSGQQSSSLALLDTHGTGVVVSSASPSSVTRPASTSSRCGRARPRCRSRPRSRRPSPRR